MFHANFHQFALFGNALCLGKKSLPFEEETWEFQLNKPAFPK